MSKLIDTQNDLLLNKLLIFYNEDNNFDKMINIINGTSKISLRIVDWFVTNYSKKNYIVYDSLKYNKMERFKVYIDYKLKLKAYSKKKFDPFCRWERIDVPYKNNTCIQTTLGQLNFFKWCIENEILDYINTNYKIIENDMNMRNSSSKVKNSSLNSNISSTSIDSSDSYSSSSSINSNNKTRKKREELSSNASKSIKKEFITTTVIFN
jgi:hypothetical protein